jgi:WhiB family transcriptional regulator, redox-sensing transcriptional regulator
VPAPRFASATAVLAADLLGDRDDTWQRRGLCRETDPDLFFPDVGVSTQTAKDVCVACPVMGECLEFALGTAQRFGVWGGTAERGRFKLARRIDRDPGNRAAIIATHLRDVKNAAVERRARRRP